MIGLIWFIISLIIIMVGGFVIWNLLQKVEALEDDNDFLQKWANQSSESLIRTLETIKEIDEKRWFQEDDEVGIVFGRLKDEINKLGEYFE